MEVANIFKKLWQTNSFNLRVNDERKTEIEVESNTEN
jgi:hypothetical protein